MIILSFIIIYISISVIFMGSLFYALDKKYKTEINKLHIYYNEKYDYDINDLNYAV